MEDRREEAQLRASAKASSSSSSSSKRAAEVPTLDAVAEAAEDAET